MSRGLLKPILDWGISTPYFFNGRLLSGEDLSREQEANRRRVRFVGESVGDGVAWGLEVSKPDVGSAVAPVVQIAPGLAVNRKGQTLSVEAQTTLSLVRPVEEEEPALTDGLFDDCQPVQADVSLADAGLYLLTISPASGSSGRARTSGLGNTPVSCNIDLIVEGVQFRLIHLDSKEIKAALAAPAHLRNAVAHLCYGTETVAGRLKEGTVKKYGELDALRPDRLTDCDVPLALIQWARDDGIGFVDLWSVRRPVVDPEALREWNAVVGARRLAEAEAAFLQFQEQLSAIRAAGQAAGLAADERFRFLPAAGYLPTGAGGFDWKRFLGPLAPPAPTPVDGSLLRAVFLRSFAEDPVRVGSFAESLKAGVAPPVPVRVFRVPESNDFVLFARSSQGRIRVFLDPPSANPPTSGIYAESETHTKRLNAAAISQGIAPILEVAPGDYRVRVEMEGHEKPAPQRAAVVAGRTTDVSVKLVPLPNGEILVRVVEDDGRPVNSVKTVNARGEQTGEGEPVSVEKGVWLIKDLPPGTYEVEVFATGYKSKKQAGIKVEHARVTVKVALESDEKCISPPLCVNVKRFKVPPLVNVRLCMVIPGETPSKGLKYVVEKAELSARASEYMSYTATTREMQAGKTAAMPGTTINDMQAAAATPLSDAAKKEIQDAIVAGQLVELADIREAVKGKCCGDQFESIGKAKSKGYYLLAQDYQQPVYMMNYTEASISRTAFGAKPWEGMMKITPLPDNVTEWLLAWQTCFEETRSRPFKRVAPSIYIDREYMPPRGEADIRRMMSSARAATALAVFGDEVSVPVTISTVDTKYPLHVTEAMIPGSSKDELHALEVSGYRTIGQVAAADEEAVMEALGKSRLYARSIIADARKEIEKINDERRYLSGVDDKVNKKLNELSLTDDVALANADPVELGEKLESLGLAYRLIEQARAIAPTEAWSLEAVGLSRGEIFAMRDEGITSQGELVARTQNADRVKDAEAINRLSEKTGVGSQLLGSMRDTAVTKMAAGSIEHAPATGIISLGGVNASSAGALAGAGFETVDALAGADAAEVAEKTGLSVTMVSSLKAEAEAVVKSRSDIGRLAPVTNDEAIKLSRDFGVTSFNDLAGKDPQVIKDAFGGDADKARAVIEGVRNALRARTRITR